MKSNKKTIQKNQTLLFRLQLAVVVLFGTLLLSFRLSELMMFIGDFGWFYLASRDMLLSGQIPLVGIPSSHPWLHQGPLWTYMLGTGLWLSQFNPLSGAVIGIIFGIGSILLIYNLTESMYGKRVGLLTALLYATSPLIIIHARMPYHTAPIPFFTLLLFLGVYRFISGQPYYLALVFFSLSVLYNLELATVVYVGLVAWILVFGLLKKKAYVNSFLNKKVLGVAFFAGIIPMIPVLLYDTTHGFPQTMKFAAWIGYKVLTIFGYPPLHPEIIGSTYPEVIIFFFQHIQKLLFLPSFFISLLLFIGALIWFGIYFKQKQKVGKLTDGDMVLGLFIFFGIGGFFATKTTSEAYLPMLFPQIILLMGLWFSSVRGHRFIRYFAFLFVSLMVLVNSVALVRSNYLMAIPLGGYGPTFAQRIAASEIIINKAGKTSYTIVGDGPGSEFPSFTMNYEYLTWYLGKGPDKKSEKTFTILDTPASIRIESRKYD